MQVRKRNGDAEPEEQIAAAMGISKGAAKSHTVEQKPYYFSC